MGEAHEAISPCFPDLAELPIDAVLGRSRDPSAQPVAHPKYIPAAREGRELGCDRVDVSALFGRGLSLLTRGTV